MTGAGATPEGAGTEEQLSFGTSQGRWVIVVTVLGSGIAPLDATVVSIVLPAIPRRSFHSNIGTLQWVVTGYALTLAAFLPSVVDWVTAWDASVSSPSEWSGSPPHPVRCCFAPNAGVLIAARLLQGVGGALLAPASLAILQTSFRPDDPPRAIGAWTGLGGVATAAGPLVGGYLIIVGSWRWVSSLSMFPSPSLCWWWPPVTYPRPATRRLQAGWTLRAAPFWQWSFWLDSPTG